MNLYNKGNRAFILSKADSLSGCNSLAHDLNKDRVYFQPNTEAELRDPIAEKMLAEYPKELMQVDKNRVKGKIKKVVAAQKKTPVVVKKKKA